VAAAEDALGDAFAAALAQWPAQGVPERPDAWLVAAARRRLQDGRRRARVRDAAEPALAHEVEAAARATASHLRAVDGDALFPDRRVALLFACAHPAVDEAVRTPLMLQVVLGLDAAVVANAFLAAPAAMAQRLVRAKRKLRDAGVPFAVPEAHELAPRLDAVLEAIYGAFGAGWGALAGTVAGGDTERADLAEEAIWLGRVVAGALPDEPEAQGLLALMLYCHARRAARYDADGGYVPLAAQDAARWDRALIGEAERRLVGAARALRPGRFQLEAALQSAHLAPAFGRAPDARAIAALHDALVAHAPTVGALVSRAAAIGEASGAAAGLVAAEAIRADGLADYQPWWAVRAHLLARLGRAAEAGEAYARAAGPVHRPGRARLPARPPRGAGPVAADPRRCRGTPGAAGDATLAVNRCICDLDHDRSEPSGRCPPGQARTVRTSRASPRVDTYARARPTPRRAAGPARRRVPACPTAAAPVAPMTQPAVVRHVAPPAPASSAGPRRASAWPGSP
jgi:RNA polymerase sigma-70 factor (ECF subfamily)